MNPRKGLCPGLRWRAPDPIITALVLDGVRKGPSKSTPCAMHYSSKTKCMRQKMETRHGTSTIDSFPTCQRCHYQPVLYLNSRSTAAAASFDGNRRWLMTQRCMMDTEMAAHLQRLRRVVHYSATQPDDRTLWWVVSPSGCRKATGGMGGPTPTCFQDQ